MKNVYLQISEMLPGNPLVLATVTRTSGSTPQIPGSSAIISAEKIISGTIGGGKTEGSIVQISRHALKSQKSGHYLFQLDNDPYQDKEPICGGHLNILVDANPSGHLEVFRQIRQSVEQRVPGVLVTMIHEMRHENVEIDRYWITNSKTHNIPAHYSEKVEEEVADILKARKYGDYREIAFFDPSKTLFFMEAIFPLPELFIAGAGHIGKALSHFGNLLDFEVTVIDDRSEYANSSNIPDAEHIIVDDIGKAIGKLKKTNDTFIVIVTRGHKDDRLALEACLNSEAAYIGMIGSSTKIESMKNRLISEGTATMTQLDRIYAPVGINIRSKTVNEIAVSIAAQLVMVKNGMRNE